MLVNLIVQIPEIAQMAPQQFVRNMTAPLVVVAVFALLAWVLNVVGLVFQYVCYNDLYASCCPENQVLFLVLSILFNVTLPFFVFACRNKDGGMPPRKDEIPAAAAVEAESL
jgi:hypothetical protein